MVHLAVKLKAEETLSCQSWSERKNEFVLNEKISNLLKLTLILYIDIYTRSFFFSFFF